MQPGKYHRPLAPEDPSAPLAFHRDTGLAEPPPCQLLVNSRAAPLCEGRFLSELVQPTPHPLLC